jgi:hypothetical protein
MEPLVSQLGAWKDADRYGIRSNLSEIKQTISGGYDLSDYKQKRRFYKELSAENHLVWRAIKTFEECRDSFPNVLTEAAVTALYNDITINPTDADILNANALLMAYEYLFRLNRAKTSSAKEFNDWVEKLVALGQDLKLAHKPDQPPTLTPVQLFDVMRYARYIAMHLKMDANVRKSLQKLLLTSDVKVKLTNSREIEPCFPETTYADPLTSQDILPPPTGKIIKVSIDGAKEITLPLYPYDTIGTIQRRIAILQDLPLPFVRFKEAVDILQENVVVKTFGATTITFHDVDWKYNPNENKILHFETAIGEVATIVMAKEDSNVLNEISTYFHLLEEENRKPICPQKMFASFALVLLLKANNLPTATIKNIRDAISKPEMLTRYKRKIEALRGTFEREHKTKPADLITMDALFYAQMQMQKAENDKRLKIFSRYMQGIKKPSLSIAQVKQTDYRISGTFALPRTDIYQLFNQMPVGKNIPFARAGKFVKAINNIIVPSEWTELLEETNDCSFYIATVDNPKIYKRDQKQYFSSTEEFVKCTLKELHTKGSETSFSFEIVTSDEEVETTVLQSLVEALQHPSISIKAKKTFAGGVTIVNQLAISFYMLHDFTLNNPFVADTIRINERSNIYKLKQTITDKEGQKEMSASAKMRILLSKDSSVFVDATLSKIIPESPKSPERMYFHVPSQREVWSLELRGALSTEQVTHLLNKFLIALEMSCVSKKQDTFCTPWYCRQTTDIYHFFEAHTFKVSNKENYILSAPDLFVSNYKRRCEDRPVAQPYSAGAYALAKQAAKLEDRVAQKFPYTDQPSYILTCPYPDKKHVGLIVNTTLKNKALYPYIPCCYQNELPLAKFYFSGKEKTFPELEEKVKELSAGKTTGRANRLGHTKAITKKDVYGDLYPRFQKFVSIIDTEVIDNKSVLTQDYSYLRKGAGSEANLSALACLQQATGKMISTENLSAFILRTGCTESAGLTTKTAVEILRNNGYIDVRAFYQALRQAFEVEIILFMQDKEYNMEGTLACEYFDRVRIVNVKDVTFPTAVVLNVHKGAEYDNLEIYNTELVVKVLETKGKLVEVQKQFETSSLLIKQCMNAIDQLYPTQYIGFDTKDKLIEKQQYDSFGKTRGFVIQTEEAPVHIYTTPIPNVICTNQQSSSVTTHLLSYEKAREIWPESQVVVYKPRNQVIGVFQTKDEVGAYMPVEPIPFTEDMGEKYNTDLYSYPIPVSLYEQNFTERYSLYVRMSNFIKCYMLWLFSKYIYEENIEDIEAAIPKWFEERVIVEANTTYNESMVERAFSIRNTTIVEDNKKLVLRSMEAGRKNAQEECDGIGARLKYILQQYVKFHDTVLYDFREENYIPNYYTSSFSFRSSPAFTVYNTANEYRTMMEGSKSIYNVKYSFEDIDISYYVKIQEEVFLVCRAKSVANALAMEQSYALHGSIWTEETLEIDPAYVSVYVGVLEGIREEFRTDETDWVVGRLGETVFAMMKVY